MMFQKMRVSKACFLFQKSGRIEKLVHKASHVRWMKIAARNKLYFMVHKGVSNKLL